MPSDMISHMIQLAKDSPAGLHFTDQLGNAYAGDLEINPGPITVWFIDAPLDSHIVHDKQIRAYEDAENMDMKSLTNNTDVNTKNITIIITGVTDEEENENTIDNSEPQVNNNPIEDHDYGFSNTVEDIKQTRVGVTIDHDVKPTGGSNHTTPN